MSARRAFAKRKYNLPTLPPELWLHIFSFATSAAELSDTDSMVRNFAELSDWHIETAMKQSLVTKRHLIRVCKQWNALASKHLYESIYLGQYRTLLSLCRTLLNSREESKASSDGKSLGCWTKRLHIAIRDQSPHGAIDFDSLVATIRCLSNLSIISFSLICQRFRDQPFPTAVLQALAETCGPSLQIITWSRSSPCPCAWDFSNFIAATPNIRVIACPSFYSIDNATLPVLPKLQILCLGSGSMAYCPDTTNRFPALREILYLDVAPIPPHITSIWTFLLPVYGFNLSVFTIRYDFHNIYLQGELDLLTNLCPNLVRLNIEFRTWTTLFLNLTLPPVTYFGIRCREIQSPSRKYEGMFAALASLKTSALKFVQLRDHRHVFDVRHRHEKVFKEGIALLKSRGLCLLDHEGCILE